MPTILNDRELKSLFGTVLRNAAEECLRPNSYVLRLGTRGEFINTGKQFDLSRSKRGIQVHPGHLVGVTAFEDLDFRREAVHKVFPGHDLHAFVSPTTDLSREGMIAPTTQVDAGFHGTLNWTLTNNSNEERRFLFKEKIYRITIFKLDEGESPEHLYSGDYQNQKGYVRSRRAGAPVGMKESEWVGPFVKGGPQDLLDQLMSSGYPWGILGKRLKEIDQQFKDVTEEYSEIHDSIEALKTYAAQIQERQSDTPNMVRKILREEVGALQNKWLIGAGALFVGAIGLFFTLSTDSAIWGFLQENSLAVGLTCTIAAAATLIFIVQQK